MTDRELIKSEIERMDRDTFRRGVHLAFAAIKRFIAALPAEPEPMVRWRTVIETPIGVDEEFHTNLDAAEEYIEMCALDRPSTITKCEIREVQND
jgi:hypothetical protein